MKGHEVKGLTDDLTVRAIQKEDYINIADFLAERTNNIFQSSLWMDRFDLWWDNNPAMREDICRGWMLCGNTGEVLGFIGNIPVKYLIMGQEKIICSATSWYMNQDYKAHSLKLLNLFLKQDRALLDTTPADNVAKMLIRLGFNYLNKEWLKREAIYPVSIIDFWSLFVSKITSMKVAAMFLNILGVISVPTLKIYQIIRKIGMNSAGPRYSFKEIYSFDESYDVLCSKQAQDHGISALRNSVTLNWFFFGSKGLRSTRRVIEIRDQEKLLGYVGVKLGSVVINNKERYFLEVVDIVLTDESELACFTALEGILSLAKNSDKKITFINMNPFVNNLEKYLIRFGFMWRNKSSSILYRGIDDNNIDEGKYMENIFHATPLDGDRCFFP